jgi:hypothetical protein
MGDFPWDLWNEIIDATIGRRWRYDNHGTLLSFGEFKISTSPGRYESLLLDRFVATEFGMDLVENTVNAVWSKHFDEQNLKMSLSEKLLRTKVVSLQTIDGPWHPAIQDLRTDGLLKSYRRKVGAVADLRDISTLDTRLGELSSEFERITRKIVADHLSTSSLGESTVMFILGLIPALGNIVGAGGLLKDVLAKLEARRNAGWVGLLGKATAKLGTADNTQLRSE